jgi:hypothetical protein
VLLLYVLLLAFFPESCDFLLSGPGFALLLLAIVGYTMFVVIKAVFWGDSKLTAIVMIALLLIVLDMGITRKIPPEHRGEVWSHVTALFPFLKDSNGGRTAAVCKGEYERHRLTPSASLMEGGADCSFDYEVKYGKVRFCPATGTCVEVGAGPGMALDRRIRYVTWQSVGTEAVIHAAFCDRGRSWNGSRCS